MKKTIFSSLAALIVIALISFVFTPDAASTGSATGTIKVCWGLTCTSDAVTTVVTLRDSNGRAVGSCTITPPVDCCKITGDFPTGTYYFTYNRPTGVSQCTTGTFSYTNGTDITLSPICFCP